VGKRDGVLLRENDSLTKKETGLARAFYGRESRDKGETGGSDLPKEHMRLPMSCRQRRR
jgi:hypothetical protein